MNLLNLLKTPCHKSINSIGRVHLSKLRPIGIAGTLGRIRRSYKRWNTSNIAGHPRRRNEKNWVGNNNKLLHGEIPMRQRWHREARKQTNEAEKETVAIRTFHYFLLPHWRPPINIQADGASLSYRFYVYSISKERILRDRNVRYENMLSDLRRRCWAAKAGVKRTGGYIYRRTSHANRRPKENNGSWSYPSDIRCNDWDFSIENPETWIIQALQTRERCSKDSFPIEIWNFQANGQKISLGIKYLGGSTH